jgi:hypothetical protein
MHLDNVASQGEATAFRSESPGFARRELLPLPLLRITIGGFLCQSKRAEAQCVCGLGRPRHLGSRGCFT